MHDYIIIGAGSAGCVLASRLSADSGCGVLVLEAGGSDAHPLVRIPAAFSQLFKTKRDWNFETVAQPGCANRRMYWPRGRMLGGSSSLNAMIYMRGHRADYDAWAALGNRGWGYNDLLPYFKRNEGNAQGASTYHGADGPLSVTDLRDPHPMHEAMRAGFEAEAVPASCDFNGAEQDGAGLNQVTMKNGRRWSAADAYLRPALKRSNLKVIKDAQVRRVIFDGRRATGVEYSRGGRTEVVHATREILLCGGAINSPQLLLLSGIGRADHVRDLGIGAVQDVPGVGENLLDHLIAGVIVGVTRTDTLAAAESIGSLLKYIFQRRGLLTSNVAEMCAFVRTQPGLAAPDLQFHMAPGYFFNHGLGREKIHGAAIGPTLIQPHSVGRITLASPDPLAHPAIDPRYFSDERDLPLLVTGFKMARRVFASHAFDGLRTAELKPGAQFQSDAEIAQAIRETCHTLYHPVGTCKMGPESDPLAVVDGSLRVRGVDGLRVVDASIMPTIPRGNTNAPTMAIAEKAADLIIGQVA